MKKIILFNIILIIFLFVTCSKDPINPTDQTLLGLWECDSTVLGSVHSMMFKSKKYEFKESDEYERTWTFPIGFKDWGKWNYNSESNQILLSVDSIFEEEMTLTEEIDINSIDAENLILIEDYDSLILQNGEIEFIKEYYSKKK